MRQVAHMNAATCGMPNLADRPECRYRLCSSRRTGPLSELRLVPSANHLLRPPPRRFARCRFVLRERNGVRCRTEMRGNLDRLSLREIPRHPHLTMRHCPKLCFGVRDQISRGNFCLRLLIRIDSRSKNTLEYDMPASGPHQHS
jgi:hypothetical protein